MDDLRQVPAAVRFLSSEPLLGSLDALDVTGIDWVIVGGESGRRARPMDIGIGIAGTRRQPHDHAIVPNISGVVRATLRQSQSLTFSLFCLLFSAGGLERSSGRARRSSHSGPPRARQGGTHLMAAAVLAHGSPSAPWAPAQNRRLIFCSTSTSPYSCARGCPTPTSRTRPNDGCTARPRTGAHARIRDIGEGADGGAPRKLVRCRARVTSSAREMARPALFSDARRNRYARVPFPVDQGSHLAHGLPARTAIRARRPPSS
ncbi:DUF5131 family protein [Streptomyces rhizosphaericus]|uniref:DUF5131 family protein n=1 Tax=Streptomyces rhizosphaericus TaxID=114699 RepID=UPI001BA516CA|nr:MULTISPECIES: DUF5131 family protein [Streptomyces violaceusniger group]